MPFDSRPNPNLTGVPKIVMKTSRQTINNTTILVNDSELIFEAMAGIRYTGQIYFLYKSQASADMKFTFTDDGGLNEGSFHIGHGTANRTAFGTTIAVATAGGNQVIILPIMFHVKPSVSDTIRLQWAQNIAQVSDTYVDEGSMMIYGEQ